MAFITFIVILSILTTGLLQPELTLSDLARQAAVEYEAGNYEAALVNYEALVSSGVQDSAVYINLGHTYFQLQDFGRALASYRHAQAFHPRDSQVNSSLARVRSLRTDIQGDETAFIDSIAAMTIPILTTTELTWLMVGVWCLFFVFVTGIIVRKQWRDTLRGVFVLLMVTLLLGLLLWGCRLYVDHFRPAGVVIEPSVSVMSGPAVDYLTIYTLHAAAELRVLEQRDGWVRFILPDQRQGWVQAEAIEII